MKNATELFVFTILGLLAVFACTVSFSPTSQASGVCAVKSVRASHILVDSRAEADSIKSKIDNGESFETMAKTYSKCPSGANGGDLGFFERGQMVKEFENAAFDLPIGKVSVPIKTQFGWHLIKVSDKK